MIVKCNYLIRVFLNTQASNIPDKDNNRKPQDRLLDKEHEFEAIIKAQLPRQRNDVTVCKVTQTLRAEMGGKQTSLKEFTVQTNVQNPNIVDISQVTDYIMAYSCMGNEKHGEDNRHFDSEAHGSALLCVGAKVVL